MYAVTQSQLIIIMFVLPCTLIYTRNTIVNAIVIAIVLLYVLTYVHSIN